MSVLQGYVSELRGLMEAKEGKKKKSKKAFQKKCPTGVSRDLEATGTCYEDAANYLLFKAPRNAVMVHGRPRLQRPPWIRFGHAWIEVGNKIIDPSVRPPFESDRGFYYGLGDIDYKDNLVYTQDEARNYLLYAHHYGPWEGPEGVDPMEDPWVDEPRRTKKAKKPNRDQYQVGAAFRRTHTGGH